MDTNPQPALVAGADSPTGLALARALAADGVPVIGAAVHAGAPTCRSVHWTEIQPVAAPTAAGWLDALRAVHARHGRVVLLPADDAVVRIVAQHRAEVDALADVVLPDLATTETLLDKTEFCAWAEAHALPVPRTVVVTSPAELDAALGRMTFPVVLKPFERTAAWQAVSMRDKVRRLDSRHDLDALPFDLYAVADRFVVQEWIPGLDSDVWFCLVYRDRDGVTLGSCVGRKITQWPVDTGSSALAVTADDPELAALTQRLLDAAGHVGFGSLEVRRSSRDGRMLITEPTVGRPNLQSGLAGAAGVDLAVIAYRDVAGLPQHPSTPARPALWVHESAFPRSVVVAARHGRLDVRALLAALVSRRTRTGAFGARGDRRPVRAEVARLLGKATRQPVAPAPAPQLLVGAVQ